MKKNEGGLFKKIVAVIVIVFVGYFAIKLLPPGKTIRLTNTASDFPMEYSLKFDSKEVVVAIGSNVDIIEPTKKELKVDSDTVTLMHESIVNNTTLIESFMEIRNTNLDSESVSEESITESLYGDITGTDRTKLGGKKWTKHSAVAPETSEEYTYYTLQVSDTAFTTIVVFDEDLAKPILESTKFKVEN